MALPAGDVVIRVIGSALGAHPGAEVVGTVSATGESAAEWLGRAVLVPRLLPCGECNLCQRGRVALCPHLRQRGAPVAEEQVPGRFLLPLEPPFLPAAIPAEDLWRHAALADALSTPYAGLVRAGQSPGELCVILGGGFRAAAALLVVRALGCQAVVVCPQADVGTGESDGERLCAPPFLALAALDSLGLDPEAASAKVRELAAAAGLPVHGICHLETTGSDAGRARALAMAEAGGTAVLLDRPEQPGSSPPATTNQPSLAAPLHAGPGLAPLAALERLCRDEGQVIGVRGAHPDLLPELLALVVRAGVDLAALTTAIAPADIDEVLAQRRRRQGDRLTLPIVVYP